MPLPQGLASFPGVEHVRGVVFAHRGDILPSVATLEIVPQTALIATVGTLSLDYGDVHLQFPDCRVDRATLVHDEQGRIVRLTLLDRRWKWQFGRISGQYNLRHRPSLGLTEAVDAPNFLPDTEQTPVELLTLCLEAMGETNFDLSAVPNDARPTVHWQNVVPAEALRAVAQDVGCRVVLRLDQSVAVVPCGSGAALPLDETVIDALAAIDPVGRPDERVILARPTQYQVDLPLEAVALDRDGAVLPIDQLSYTPEGGWARVDLEFLHEVAYESARDLARQSVFRWYRLSDAAIEALPEDVTEPITSTQQLLPLELEQLDTVATSDGARAREPIVYGVWHDRREATDFATHDGNRVAELVPLDDPAAIATEASVYPGRFTIDAKRGIVRFAEPVFAYQRVLDGPSGPTLGFERVPAQLRLRTSVTLRTHDTRTPLAWERRRTLNDPPLGTEPQYLQLASRAGKVIVRYGEDFAIEETIDNFTDLEAHCDRLLDMLETLDDRPAPTSVRYAGLRAINVDGAIDQVTWIIDRRGTTTHARRESSFEVAIFPDELLLQQGVR